MDQHKYLVRTARFSFSADNHPLHMWNPSSLLVAVILATGSGANPPPGLLFPPVAPLNIPDKVSGISPPQEDLLAIQRTMSLYPFVLDGKAWDQLDRIFHPDIWANYSGYIGVVHTIPQVTAALSKIMAPVTSQHALSTQLIEVSPNGTTADSWTYYWANHFGTGQHFGQVSGYL